MCQDQSGKASWETFSGSEQASTAFTDIDAFNLN
jgi:hypothetical protein